MVSALVYGVSFMAISGLLATWSYRIFPERPSAGFSATVLALGIGAILGPATLGLAANAVDLPTALLLTAAVAGGTILVRPQRSATRAGSRDGVKG